MSEVLLRAVVESRGVDVEFAVAAGEVLAVLGPNGAGKSTALHVIAGLVRPDNGVVRVGERMLTDTSTGIDVATHDRRVGLLLQDPLLFPHLDVAANVAFAPRSRRGFRRRLGSRRFPGGGGALAGSGRCRRPGRIACRASCPADRRSGSRWPARWPPNPTSCCSTNLWPALTWPRQPRCARCCAACWPATAGRRC